MKNNILEVEITNISQHGFWIFIKGKESFLSFQDFPWFKSATITNISDVNLLHDTHLYWNKLDIDLDIQSLDNPDFFPLVYK